MNYTDAPDPADYWNKFVEQSEETIRNIPVELPGPALTAYMTVQRVIAENSNHPEPWDETTAHESELSEVIARHRDHAWNHATQWQHEGVLSSYAREEVEHLICRAAMALTLMDREEGEKP